MKRVFICTLLFISFTSLAVFFLIKLIYFTPVFGVAALVNSICAVLDIILAATYYHEICHSLLEEENE